MASGILCAHSLARWRGLPNPTSHTVAASNNVILKLQLGACRKEQGVHNSERKDCISQRQRQLEIIDKGCARVAARQLASFWCEDLRSKRAWTKTIERRCAAEEQQSLFFVISACDFGPSAPRWPQL